MFHAFDSLVVEVDVCNSNLLRQADRIDSEPVILGRNFHLIEIGIENRLISSMVSELKLECTATEGESHDLVTQANSEDRLLAKQLPDVADRVVHSFGVARTVGKEDAIGLQIQDFFCRSLRRHYRNAPATMHEVPENVGLDAEVVGHNMT